MSGIKTTNMTQLTYVHSYDDLSEAQFLDDHVARIYTQYGLDKPVSIYVYEYCNIDGKDTETRYSLTKRMIHVSLNECYGAGLSHPLRRYLIDQKNITQAFTPSAYRRYISLGFLAHELWHYAQHMARNFEISPDGNHYWVKNGKKIDCLLAESHCSNYYTLPWEEEANTQAIEFLKKVLEKNV